MFIPKSHRIAIYSYLFKEGVCVVQKKYTGPHPEIEDVANLEVLMLMKSLESRGFVKITYSWQHSYCYLITEAEEGAPTGLDYLRTYLALPAEIVPATMKKAAARPGAREQDGEKGGEGGAPEFRGERGDREYRGREGGAGFGRGGGGF